MKSFDEFQNLGKEGVDAAAQSFAATSQGMQKLAGEYADYVRKSFEHGTHAVEKLMQARSPERAFEVQSEFLTGAYETFMAQASKFGELYADVARQSYKPIESYVAKVSPVG
jgi:hypothetical protein